jgi:DNA repair exonuclease SbcCD nuclease subunit
MSEFRFLHAADIHLDSPMRGLEADPDAPLKLVREASRSAFRNLIDTAIDEQVAFVLIAGDLYDGDWQDWRTGLFFIEQVGRLAASGIPVIMVAGNHDAASVITRHLPIPEHVTVLPHCQAGRLVFEEYGVAVHGQSFATRAVTEDLSRNFSDPVPELFNVGLLHTSLTGRPGHESYAPTTVDTLIARGYDYWALGHVHAREIVHEDPWIVFPGNLQGRQIRESGPKGASLVTVRDRRVAAVDHRNLDVFRWCPIEVPVAGEHDLDSAMGRIGCALSASLEAAEGRPIAARVILNGVTPLHERLLAEAERVRQGVLAEGRQYGADAVWIESVVIDTASTADPRSLLGRPDVVGRLSKVLDELIGEAGPELLGDYPDRLRQPDPGV